MSEIKINKRLIGLIILLLLFVTSKAQKGRLNFIYKQGIYFASGLGISRLMAEIPNNLSSAIREFHNQPGISGNFIISKYITGNLELGTGLSLSILRGKAPGPSAFSATGIHGAMKNLKDEPIIYRNRLLGPQAFMRYYFLNRSKHPDDFRITPFFGVGAGFIFYVSDLRYKNYSEHQIIFGKSLGQYKDSHTANMVYFLQPGIRTSVSPRVDIKTYLNLNFVNYDFLDVVHNYNSDGTRIELVGLYTEFLFNISIKLEKSNVPFMKKYKKQYNEYLPWYRRK